MATFYGTDQSDYVIGSELSPDYSWIDAQGGDDDVTLARGQTFISGEGNDRIIGLSASSGYGLWFAPGIVEVNLLEGWAKDGFGYIDTLIDIREVHMPGHGGTVIGSDAADKVFCFGGDSKIDLGAGSDSVYMWELDSDAFQIRQLGTQVTLSNGDCEVGLTNVEQLIFSDRSISLTPGMTDGEVLEAAGTLHSFEETEFSPGWWYAGEYNEPQLVGYFPQAGSVVDIGSDGDLDVIVPMNRGYRSGVDTRFHFQVFENIDGELSYSESLTELTPFITGSRRTETLYLERYQAEVLVTVAHDTAIETETRTDIPWRLGDISITRLDQFADITTELVPSNTLPDSNYVGRLSAVNAHAMAVGDINADGLDDIFVGQFGEPFALLQTVAGAFEYRSDPVWTALNGPWLEPTLDNSTAAFPLDLDIADYNGDGFDDILYGRGHGTTLSRILFNDGSGGFDPENSVPLPASVYGASNNLHMKSFSEDFDADGDVDLVILNSRDDPYYGGNYLQYLVNDGNANFTDETEARLAAPDEYVDTYQDRLNWTDFWQVLDIEGDGDLDILGHSVDSWSATNALSFTNDGRGYFTLDYLPMSAEGRPIAWSDFDNNGSLDALNFSSRWNDSEGSASTNSFTLSSAVSYSSSTPIAFDVEGANSAGGIYRTYQAAFNRTPDPSGLGYWIAQADAGMSAVEIAERFTWSDEFLQTYAVQTPDNYLAGSNIEAVVDRFYRNVLDRDPDQGGLDYYTSVISTLHKTCGRVLAEIADSPENRANVQSSVETGISYELWLG